MRRDLGHRIKGEIHMPSQESSNDRFPSFERNMVELGAGQWLDDLQVEVGGGYWKPFGAELKAKVIESRRWTFLTVIVNLVLEERCLVVGEVTNFYHRPALEN